MANKALAKRQKLMARAQPAPRQATPRNPFALAARQRAAGPHRKTTSAERQPQDLLIRKLPDDTEAGD